MSHLILVDANALGFAGMNNSRLSAGNVDTQSTFTVIRTTRNLFLNNPDALIIYLYDGRSWRKDIYGEYKANRTQTAKQIETREAYFVQKASTVKALRYLGVTMASADNYEADDLAQYYGKSWKGDKVTLIASDKDWLQLVDERTTWVDLINERQCTNVNFQAFTGCKTIDQFLETKYLLGDSGDNIKGLKGVGPKTVDKLFGLWDSVKEFAKDDDRYRKWQLAYKQKLPAALDVPAYDIYELLEKNERLMSLYTLSRPKPVNLRKTTETLNEKLFMDFCYEHSFLSFLKDYDRFLQPFKENKFVRI